MQRFMLALIVSLLAIGAGAAATKQARDGDPVTRRLAQEFGEGFASLQTEHRMHSMST